MVIVNRDNVKNCILNNNVDFINANGITMIGNAEKVYNVKVILIKMNVIKILIIIFNVSGWLKIKSVLLKDVKN